MNVCYPVIDRWYQRYLHEFFAKRLRKRLRHVCVEHTVSGVLAVEVMVAVELASMGHRDKASRATRPLAFYFVFDIPLSGRALREALTEVRQNIYVLENFS